MIKKANKNTPPQNENLLDLPDLTSSTSLHHSGTLASLATLSTTAGAAQCGGKDNSAITQSHIDALDDDPLFADIKTLWDEQSTRIDHFIATHPEARPVRLNFRHHRPWRRRVMSEYLILGFLNVAASIYTLFTLLPDPYILIHITGIVLASTNAFLAVHSLYFYFIIRRHHPARVSVASMSCFIRRMHMEPHYAPQPYKRRSRKMNVDLTLSTQLQLGKTSKLVLRSTFATTRNAMNTAISSARQVAAISATAIVILTAVSCSPVDDRYAMTKTDRASRIVAIEYIESMISQI